MQLYRDPAALPPELKGGAVTIGNFDGVHRGHRALVEELVAAARALPGPALAVTFDPHPIALLQPELAPHPLTWTERKAELLSSAGVDAVLALKTTPELLQLDARTFFQQVVVEALAAKVLVEGPNFHFGRARQGDLALLETLCQEAGIVLRVVDSLQEGDAMISSTRIRIALAEGDIALANALLTHPYRLRGTVIQGAQRGRELGFPTVNLEAAQTILPAHGVYAGRLFLEGKTYPVAINIGPNPTFGEDREKIEAHILDYEGNLYRQALEFEILARVRDVMKFTGPQDLIKQLHKDLIQVRQVFLTAPPLA